MRARNTLFAASFLLPIALGLVGCGGGGSSSIPTPVPVVTTPTSLTRTGTLTSSSLKAADSTYYDLYTFTASATGTATITMTSSAYVPRIEVKRPDGSFENSPQTSGSTASNSFAVQSGITYTFFAGQYASGNAAATTGSYALTFGTPIAAVSP